MINKSSLTGTLTRDPELKYPPTGIAFCRFPRAVNRRSYGNREGNQQTDFLPVTCWRNTAETCARILKKGSRVAVSGSIQTGSYDAQDGSKRYTTEIDADEGNCLFTKADDYSDVQELPEVKAGRTEDARPRQKEEDEELPCEKRG